MDLTKPQLLHVGAEARAQLKEWAEGEGVMQSSSACSMSSSRALRRARRCEKNCGWNFAGIVVYCKVERFLWNSTRECRM
jgi:hypothetical protein